MRKKKVRTCQPGGSSFPSNRLAIRVSPHGVVLPTDSWHDALHNTRQLSLSLCTIRNNTVKNEGLTDKSCWVLIENKRS